MAPSKTVRIQCVAKDGCSLKRTWSDGKSISMAKGDTLDVPVEKARWLTSLTNFKKVNKTKTNKPKV